MSSDPSHSHKCTTQEPASSQQGPSSESALISPLNPDKAFIIRIQPAYLLVKRYGPEFTMPLKKANSTGRSSWIEILNAASIATRPARKLGPF